MATLLIGHFISLQVTEMTGWGEGQCRVENRNNLSRIMWRYLTPSYGLGPGYDNTSD